MDGVQVPGSVEKNDLLQVLEKIPVHCQQLQVLVKSPTVGKSQTFNKVKSRESTGYKKCALTRRTRNREL